MIWENMPIMNTVISLVIVAALFFTMVLSKKLHYFLGGFTLIAIGILPFLFDAGIINIEINNYPILKYAAYFFLAFASKDLFVEAFKERESILKIPTLVFALTLLVILALPTLKASGVVVFIPDVPDMITNIIYILAGIFLILGVFTLLSTSES